MSKIIDQRGPASPGKARELYDDGDTEQREGSATPRAEPMRDALLGKKPAQATERPAHMSESRPRPPETGPKD